MFKCGFRPILRNGTYGGVISRLPANAAAESSMVFALHLLGSYFPSKYPAAFSALSHGIETSIFAFSSKSYPDMFFL